VHCIELARHGSAEHLARNLDLRGSRGYFSMAGFWKPILHARLSYVAFRDFFYDPMPTQAGFHCMRSTFLPQPDSSELMHALGGFSYACTKADLAWVARSWSVLAGPARWHRARGPCTLVTGALIDSGRGDAWCPLCSDRKRFRRALAVISHVRTTGIGVRFGNCAAAGAGSRRHGTPLVFCRASGYPGYSHPDFPCQRDIEMMRWCLFMIWTNCWQSSIWTVLAHRARITCVGAGHTPTWEVLDSKPVAQVIQRCAGFVDRRWLSASSLVVFVCSVLCGFSRRPTARNINPLSLAYPHLPPTPAAFQYTETIPAISCCRTLLTWIARSSTGAAHRH